MNPINFKEMYPKKKTLFINFLQSLKSKINQNYKGLTKIERDALLSRYLNLQNYSIESIEKIRNLSPDGQAAFMEKTFYFAKSANKLQVNEEAFHAIFQTIISPKEKTILYSIAEDILNRRLKTNNLSKKELYDRIGKYTKMSGDQLNNYILEEELAKVWVNYATYGEFLINQDSFRNLWKEKDLSIVEKVLESLKILFSRLNDIVKGYNNNDYLQNFFNSIQNGDYVSKSPINVSGYLYPSYSSLMLTPFENGKQDFILNPIEQTLHYNRILSITNQLFSQKIVKESGEYYTIREIIEDAIDIYNQEFLSKQKESSNEYLLSD